MQPLQRDGSDQIWSMVMVQLFAFLKYTDTGMPRLTGEGGLEMGRALYPARHQHSGTLHARREAGKN